MEGVKKPYVEGAKNLEKILNKLVKQETVEIKAKVIPFFEQGERYYLIECDPQLPLEIEADTENEAEEKFKRTIEFLFNNEAKDKNLEIDLSLLKIVFDPPVGY